MGWLKSIFGWFTGGSSTVDKVVDVVAEGVDKAVYTRQEAAQDDAKDLADARAMTAPSHDSWLDVLVDGWSRVIRPGVTTWLIGGFIGWWPLPPDAGISPYWQNVFMLVLTFWFGGRALLKDLPAAIRSIRG